MTPEEINRLSVGAFAPPAHEVDRRCDQISVRARMGAAFMQTYSASRQNVHLLSAEHALREALQIIETLKEGETK